MIHLQLEREKLQPKKSFLNIVKRKELGEARFFFLTILFIGLCLLSSFLFEIGHYKKSARSLCDLVYEKIYLKSDDLKAWYLDCVTIEDEAYSFNPSQNIINEFKKKIRKIQVSHLGIHSPEEKENIWLGYEKSNGLDVIGLEGKIFVLNEYPNSPAFKVGLRRGDVLLKWNDGPIPGLRDMNHQAGQLKWKTVLGEEKTAEIQPTKWQQDLVPKWKWLDKNTAYLKIPSFIAEHVAQFDWKEGRQKFWQARHMILDLRDNNGGNFVSMLRALSIFNCKSSDYGYLVKGKKKRPYPKELEDDTGLVILDYLEKHHTLSLSRLNKYPCFNGKLSVLVNFNSASVTEIFTENIKRNGRGKVIGESTRGDVLLSVWYRLYNFPGWELSIPEAYYESPDAIKIEGNGVEPDVWVNYEYWDLIRGEDSYVKKALSL